MNMDKRYYWHKISPLALKPKPSFSLSALFYVLKTYIIEFSFTLISNVILKTAEIKNSGKLMETLHG